jgi:hypothetical protein
VALGLTRAAGHEEADSFFCFTSVMAEVCPRRISPACGSDSGEQVRDHFCQSLDKTTEGITATLMRLMAMVKHFDRVLAESLVRPPLRMCLCADG